MLIKRKPKSKFKFFASRIFILTGLAVVIFLGVAAGKETYRKYQIQKEVNSLQQEAREIEEKNQELRQLIEYCQTDVYKELEAKKKKELQKEGEKVVIIKPNPESYVDEINNDNSENQETGNLRKWWRYFFKLEIGN